MLKGVEEVADSPGEAPGLEQLWLGFGQSIAVAAGALFALLSLMLHVPVWVAALRGALLFLVLWVVVRATCWLLAALGRERARAGSPREGR